MIFQSGIQISLEKLTTEGKKFSTECDEQTQERTTNTSTDPSRLTLHTLVALSPSLFNSIKATANLTYVGLFFSIYKTASFFPLANHVLNDITVVPLVIGVTVVGGMTNNLTDPVVLNFTIPNKVSILRINYHNLCLTLLCTELYKLHLC